MTNEEAIKVLNGVFAPRRRVEEAIKLAIESLKKQVISEKAIDNNCNLHCLEDMCDSRGGHECEVCEDAYNRGLSAGYSGGRIEEQEENKKCRWHDLRKNPDDLPKDDNCVLACCCLRGENYYGVFNYVDQNWEDGVTPPNLLNYYIIAWKEIETFVDEYIFPDNADHRKQRGRTAPNAEDDHEA